MKKLASAIVGAGYQLAMRDNPLLLFIADEMPRYPQQPQQL